MKKLLLILLMLCVEGLAINESGNAAAPRSTRDTLLILSGESGGKKTTFSDASVHLGPKQVSL